MRGEKLLKKDFLPAPTFKIFKHLNITNKTQSKTN